MLVRNTNLVVGRPRGSVLIMAMVLVATLAMMTSVFASRILANQRRMETDIAASRALELAQSANDWNMERIWQEWRRQSADPIAWADVLFRTAPATDAGDLKDYDLTLWSDYGSWSAFGEGDVKLSAMLLKKDLGDALASPPQPAYVELELKAWSRVRDELTDRLVERSVRRVVKYSSSVNTSVQQSRAFDFAYFVNNFGWMWGSPIYIQGNVGSNANLSFKYSPTVNGMLYASLNPDLNAEGVVKDGYPRSDTLTQYWSKANGSTTPPSYLYPPTNPVYTEDVNDDGILGSGEDGNANGQLDFQDFPLGFPGVTATRPQERMLGQTPLDMPYLGDLSIYKDKASNYVQPSIPDIGESGGGTGGVIKQLKAPGLDPTDPANYNVLVQGVYGDGAGENGSFAVEAAGTVTNTAVASPIDAANQAKNGNLALVGTPDQPIVISGPVVVTNDLVIKGTVQGQGTIFVGRNTHIVGNVEYKTPPNWQQNDSNFSATQTDNKTADMLGLATKGSVILGQYYRNDDSWNTAKNTYFKTGFQDNVVQSYQVDPTDTSIGYVTGTYDGKPTFHGDYTALDGGKRYNTNAEFAGTSATTDRRYYESSFSNEYIQSVATARPEKVHAVIYTNHLIGGRVGDNTRGITFLGSMVARDEGIIFNKQAHFLYDPRATDSDAGSHVSITLPGNETTNTDAGMTSMVWEELAPGQ